MSQKLITRGGEEVRKFFSTFAKAMRGEDPPFAIATVILLIMALALIALSIHLNDLGMAQAIASRRATAIATQLQNEYCKKQDGVWSEKDHRCVTRFDFIPLGSVDAIELDQVFSIALGEDLRNVHSYVFTKFGDRVGVGDSTGLIADEETLNRIFVVRDQYGAAFFAGPVIRSSINGAILMYFSRVSGRGAWTQKPVDVPTEAKTVKVVVDPAKLKEKLGSRADCISAFRMESNYSLGAGSLPPEGGELEFTILPGLPYSGFTKIRVDHDYTNPITNNRGGVTIAIARFNVAKIAGGKVVLDEFEIREDSLRECSWK